MKEKDKERVKYFFKMIVAQMYLISGTITLIFVGVMAMASATVNAYEIIPWLIFLIVSGWAAFFISIDLAKENNKG